MDNCERFRELLFRQCDEPLTGEEAAALRTHLEECPACRALAEALAETQEALREEVTPPADFTDRVMAAVRAEAAGKKARRRRQTVLRWGSLAAAAVAAVLITLPRPARSSAAAGHALMAESAAAPAAAPAGDDSMLAEEAFRGPDTEAAKAEDAMEAPVRMFCANDAGVFAADGVEDFLRDRLLPESECSDYMPEREADCVLADGEDVYLLWTENGAVYWQREGEETVYTAAVTPEELEAAANMQ